MPEKLLRLGHSPDPDDAFMFYALAQDPPLIPTHGWRFEHVLQDIQTLNRRAMKGELEITAISIHAYPYVAGKYALTACGSSMGDGYGPMLIAREPTTVEALRGKTIAIPGELTTAFLALQLLLGRGTNARSHQGTVDGSAPSSPGIQHPAASTSASGLRQDSGAGTFSYAVVEFDQIPAYVRDGKADAGLIIHEGQLTFQKLGLHLAVDLGDWWMKKTGLPLPLGGNCIRKDLGRDTMEQVTAVLKSSIQYSLDHRAKAVDYALKYGRDLDRALADRFVGMYVNHWTLDYGARGREAITRLLKEGAAAGLVPDAGEIEYVTGEGR
jgi:1,4-dihydroxy-6-naphthoate synthase